MDLTKGQGGEKKSPDWVLTEDGIVKEVVEDGYAESFGIQVGAKSTRKVATRARCVSRSEAGETFSSCNYSGESGGK